MLRVIRELLAFEPRGKGTDIKLALDTVNRLLKRRSIVFLVSDFMADPESYRTPLAIANRRHDVVAVDLHDPLEVEMGNVGLLALEDPETGELVWADTRSQAWRSAYRARMQTRSAATSRLLRQAAVDCIRIGTDHDYTAPLAAFFQERSRRIRH